MNESNITSKKKGFPALIASIINKYRVVMNRGALDGIELNQRFQIYSVSQEDILDPETKESLGKLEIVRGIGKVIHVQEQMSTLESDIKESSGGRTIRKKLPFGIMGEIQETVESTDEIIEYEDVKVGDKVRPV